MSGHERINQKRRTRKALLEAAAKLLRYGETPSMEEVAQEAEVSRATAYRYFPTVDALFCEAPVDGIVPGPVDLFEGDASVDLGDRISRVDAVIHQIAFENEPQLRAHLAHSLKQSLRSPSSLGTPVRQNRRSDLIAAALAPGRDRFDKRTYDRLCASLAMIIGLESMLVFRDVLGMGPREARKVKDWAVRALVDAALLESSKKARRTRGK